MNPVGDIVGRVLGDAYRVERLVGRGGMGRVYEAMQLRVGRQVAVKMLSLDGVPSDYHARARDRFILEATATSKLRHPNTIRLIDFGVDEATESPYLVLEYLVGRSLGEVLDEDGTLEPTRAAHIGAQIAAALQEAHSQGIVHRDLKPDNIFLCDFEGDDDVVKVLDFGIARMMDTTEATRDSDPLRLTGHAEMLGSPYYMAPEQAQGARQATPQSDIYSLGIILYECLHGDPPFDGQGTLDVALKHVTEPPPRLPLDALPIQGVQVWNRLLSKMLAKEPADRPALETVLAALEALTDARYGTARGLLGLRADISAVVRLGLRRTWAERTNRLMLLGIVLTLLALATVSWASDPEPPAAPTVTTGVALRPLSVEVADVESREAPARTRRDRAAPRGGFTPPRPARSVGFPVPPAADAAPEPAPTEGTGSPRGRRVRLPPLRMSPGERTHHE